MRLAFKSEQIADLVYRSVLPEHLSSRQDRARANFKKVGKVIYLTIEGDGSALRASLSSYLRWLRLSKSLVEELT